MSWPLLDAGADAAEESVALVFGRARVLVEKKESVDPLTRKGFEGLLRQMLRELLGATTGPDQQAVAHAVRILDVDWPTLPKVQRDRVIASAQRALGGVPDLVIPRVERIMTTTGAQVIEGTKRRTAARYDLAISPSFNVVDRRVVEHAATSQAFYIRNEYGRREERFSAVARDVVSRGLEQGHDRYEIAKALSSALETTSAARSQSYWQLVSSIFMARSRTFATLSSFQEAGIEYSVWSSTLDEVTSDVCRFMDGKVLQVGAAMSRFDDVLASPNPEAVKELQPFAGVAVDEDGNRALYFKRGGERQPLARIIESGVGNIDDRGSYSHAANDKQIQDAGIIPPAHGHCRSLLIPHSGEGSSVQVPATLTPAPPLGGAGSFTGGPRAPKPPPAPPQVTPVVPTSPVPIVPTQVPLFPPAGASTPPLPPPPPPTATPSPSSPTPWQQPQAGVHFLGLKAKVPTQRLEQILGALDEAGALDFLARNPLRELIITPTISTRNANGTYVMFGRTAGTLDVRTKRAKDSFGKTMDPGVVWSVSNCAKDETSAIRRTLVHELGHHVHRSLGAAGDQIIRDAYFATVQEIVANGGKSNLALTQYALKNRLEYFSECFAAYVFERPALAAHDPVGLAMVEAVRKLGGMP